MLKKRKSGSAKVASATLNGASRNNLNSDGEQELRIAKLHPACCMSYARLREVRTYAGYRSISRSTGRRAHPNIEQKAGTDVEPTVEIPNDIETGAHID